MKATNAVIDEIQGELSSSIGKPYQDINFLYLQLLIRALTNIAILDKE